MQDIGKIVIIIGIILVIIGVLLWFNVLGFGKLPGDILYKKGNFTFYFPIVTSIVISIILTIIFALLRK